MSDDCSIEVEFFLPPAPLRPYLTSLHLTKIECVRPNCIDDFLHPEWAGLRFIDGKVPLASVGPGPMQPQWLCVANGPTSKAVHFGVETCRIWGVGLQPVGWSKFVDFDADQLANTIVDGATHPAWSCFAPLARLIFDGKQDSAAEAGRIIAFLMEQINRPVPKEDVILACQQALRDPDMASVAQLCERVGVGARSIERLCKRYFGFTPKKLLQRQRFLRSLSHYILNPDTNWSEAIDGQYYDQSQFVRDFHSFMGMSPRDYAALPHPILNPVLLQRMVDHGRADPLDLPTFARYRP